jgi:hypothetical protein
LKTLLLLGLALVGYWGPWLIHSTAPLILNGYDLSEWVTFLPPVRDGSLFPTLTLPLSGSIYLARLVFFIPLACVAGLLGLTASRYRGHTAPYLRAWWSDVLPRSPLSWALLGLAGVCCFIVLPPYEAYVRADYRAEYWPQMVMAGLTAVLIMSAFVLPSELKDVAQISLALVGLGVGAWTLMSVRPTALALLPVGWVRLGWGWGATLAGLAGLAGLGLAHLFGEKD